MDDQFADFVRARQRDLLGYAFLLSGDLDAAQDLVQDSLARCYRPWKQGQVGNLDAYVKTAIANANVSRWRRRGRLREVSTERPPDTPVADGAAERAEADALWQLLQRASARQRTVLILRFYLDLSEADIARELGISVGTVKSQLSRGLEHVRRYAEDPNRKAGSHDPA